jgi:hypothetical protein
VKRLRDSRYDGQLMMRLEAADRISLLEVILKKAVDGYNNAYCRDEVNFDWIAEAEVALGEDKE